jgi:ferredoxin-NADP reductase
LRALLEDIPAGVDVVVVQRASTADQLIHADELSPLVADRAGRLASLVGPRTDHPLHDPRYLRRVVPDLAERDVYVCGPGPFSTGVIDAARALGVAPSAIHHESFEL